MKTEDKVQYTTENRFRSWFLVINKKAYTDKVNYDNMEKYVKNKFRSVNYFCFCEECGHGTDETQGNEHIHLYLELTNGCTFSSIKKKFEGAHIEARRGNPSEARNYIFKIGSDDNIAKADTNIRPALEFGDWSQYENVIARGNGDKVKRNVDDRLVEYVERFNTLEEVEDVDLWFAKTFSDVLQRRFEAKKRQSFIDKCGTVKTNARGDEIVTINRKIFYLYGESRTGKSYGVRFKYGSKNVYGADMAKEHPFDKYNGQSVLLMDEFRSSLPFGEMLTLLDNYENDLQARYFDKGLYADTIIVSTNIPFVQQYEKIRTNAKTANDYRAFKNRFVNGVWCMVYDEHTDRRFVCCESSPLDFTAQARQKCDFSDPPVECDGEATVHVLDKDEFDIIKTLIKNNVAVTDENLEAERKRPLPF